MPSRFVSALANRVYGSSTEPGLPVLFPLIDLIDRRQTDPALDHCNKILKVHPTFFLVYAIKSYLLYLSGCPEDALAIFKLLSSSPSHPTNFDPDYVHFVSFTLRSLGMENLMIKLFENAAQVVNGSNGAVTKEAFLALAEIGRLKEQQQIALKLHKSFPENIQYLFWVLLPLILQSPEPSSRKADPQRLILFSIAHRFLKILLNKKSKTYEEFLQGPSAREKVGLPLEDQNEFWVVMKVLEMIGQWDPTQVDSKKVVGIGKLDYDPSIFTSAKPSSKEAPEIISETCTSKVGKSETLTPASNRLPLKAKIESLPEYVHLVRQDYLDMFDSDLGQEIRTKYLDLELMWRDYASEWVDCDGLIELISRMRAGLLTGDRNWHTMITINKSLVNLIEIDHSRGEGLKREVDELYSSLHEKQKSAKGSERGHLLARIDIRHRLRDKFTSKAQEGLTQFDQNLNGVILDYFSYFSDKTCLFDDLAPYLRTLSKQEVSELRSSLIKINESEGVGTEAMSETSLRKHINKEKFCRLTMHQASSPSEKDQATKFLTEYFRYLPLGDSFPSTALQPADDLAILASQALIAHWAGPQGRTQDLSLAAYILELCLSKSAHRYQARSLLIRIYRLLGNAPRTVTHLLQLGIKHIQHESLDYLGLDRCSTFSGDQFGSPSFHGTEEIEALTFGDLVNFSLSVYTKIEADTAEWISQCYLQSNYIKVEDFNGFKKRIHNSLQRGILLIEKLQIQAVEWAIFFKSPKKWNKSFASSTSVGDDPNWFTKAREILNKVLETYTQFPIDNRDFSVIPDLQPLESSGIQHQINLGPNLGAKWLWILTMTYARILLPEQKLQDHPSLQQPNFFEECSHYEVCLYEFSQNLSLLFSCKKVEEIEERGKILIEFFSSLNQRFLNVTNVQVESSKPNSEEKEDPPLKILEMIHSASKGFTLFQLAKKSLLEIYSKDQKRLNSVLKLEDEILIGLKDLEKMISNFIDEKIKFLGKDKKPLKEEDENLILKFNGIIEDHCLGRWSEYLDKTKDQQSSTFYNAHKLLKMIISN